MSEELSRVDRAFLRLVEGLRLARARAIPRLGPGRPAGWTPELLERHEAAAIVRGGLDQRGTLPTTAEVAEHFETLEGTRGVSPEYLRNLRRRMAKKRAAAP